MRKETGSTICNFRAIITYCNRAYSNILQAFWHQNIWDYLHGWPKVCILVLIAIILYQICPGFCFPGKSYLELQSFFYQLQCTKQQDIPYRSRSRLWRHISLRKLLSKLNDSFGGSFPGRNVPKDFISKRLLDKFRESGSLHGNIKSGSGKPRSVKTENHIVTVRQCWEQYPRKYTRRLYQKTDLSRSSAMCIMHQDLHPFPYKTHILQLQTDANKAERCAFGQTSVSESNTIEISWANFFSDVDEVNFHLSDKFPNRMCTFWLRPHEHQYRRRSVKKPTVWCALGPYSIIGTY